MKLRLKPSDAELFLIKAYGSSNTWNMWVTSELRYIELLGVNDTLDFEKFHLNICFDSGVFILSDIIRK